MRWAALLLAWAAAECEEPALELLQQKARKSSSEGNLEIHSFTTSEPCKGPVQVLTDVDDTFMSSGGSWPAGCDGVYQKSVIYPGFAQFVVELARGDEHRRSTDRRSAEAPSLDRGGGSQRARGGKGGFEKLLTHADGHPFTTFGLNVAGSKYGHFDDFVDFTKIGNTKFENFQEISERDRA
eukprot:g15298.t1